MTMLSRCIRPTTYALRTVARRAYSEGPYTDRGAGTVASSQGFSKKEKAHEDQYARQKEQEELKKLREELQKVKQEVENIKNEKADKK